MARIYIASSWRNEVAARELAAFLREAGHEVDCFCDPSTGRFVFNVPLPDRPHLDAKTFLESDSRARQAFREDRAWIEWADVLVMLLPCGKSAHLEAGYARGLRKTVIIYGDFPKGEIEVMYGFAHALVRQPDRHDLLKVIGLWQEVKG